MYVCGWSFALVYLFSHTCIRTLVFNILLKRFYRNGHVCCLCSATPRSTNSRIYDNFQQWTAVFIGRCPLFAPTICTHREPEKPERDRRLRVLLCPWTRERASGEHKNISTLARRVSVWLVFLVLHQYMHLHAIASLSAVFSALFAAGLTTHDF